MGENNWAQSFCRGIHVSRKGFPLRYKGENALVTYHKLDRRSFWIQAQIFRRRVIVYANNSGGEGRCGAGINRPESVAAIKVFMVLFCSQYLLNSELIAQNLYYVLLEYCFASFNGRNFLGLWDYVVFTVISIIVCCCEGLLLSCKLQCCRTVYEPAVMADDLLGFDEP
ncbi:hypothetical protein QYF36_006571 [Acer negundo]|nr:hypothetical protein QYF36_006571 [Acer negundo]